MDNDRVDSPYMSDDVMGGSLFQSYSRNGFKSPELWLEVGLLVALVLSMFFMIFSSSLPTLMWVFNAVVVVAYIGFDGMLWKYSKEKAEKVMGSMSGSSAASLSPTYAPR